MVFIQAAGRGANEAWWAGAGDRIGESRDGISSEAGER